MSTSRPGTSSGARPGTGGARPGTGQGGAQLNPIVGARPGTGQRSALASSSGRPLTGSRLGTGASRAGLATPGQTAGVGVSLNTEVTVSDRPVTQQGMMGMRATTSGGSSGERIGSAGPGRQVQDASFFMGKLHAKTSELTVEIDKLQREVEQDARDKAQCAQLERKYETLAGEVRELEGQLADYNLAMDKLRSATDPREIRQVHEQLRARNAREAEEVDRIFILRQEQEQAARRLDEEARSIRAQHEDKINQLAPHKLAKYRELLEEHAQSEVELEARAHELELLMHALHQKEAELASDRFRDEYEALEREARRLQKERDAAADDAKTARMDPNEARALLLAKVKDDKAKLEALERALAAQEDDMHELRKTLSELQADLDERMRGGGGDDAHKHELLFQRDKEMTDFLERAPAKKEEETRAQRETQTMIVKLLEHMSAGMGKEDKLLPGATASGLEEMKGDLSFKERQLESSMSTKQRLASELAKRQAELDKVNSLDAKIALELSSLLQKMDTMNSDMDAFAQIDALREAHAATKQYLQRQKQLYIRRRDAMKQQVNTIALQLENLRQSTQSQDAARSLDALEQKLRHHEQTIFHLREFIDAKAREVDYEPVKNDCFKLLSDLNSLRIKQQQQTPLASATLIM